MQKQNIWLLEVCPGHRCLAAQAGCKQNVRVGDTSYLAHDHIRQWQEERHLVGRFKNWKVSWLKTQNNNSIQCYKVGWATRTVSTSLWLVCQSCLLLFGFYSLINSWLHFQYWRLRITKDAIDTQFAGNLVRAVLFGVGWLSQGLQLMPATERMRCQKIHKIIFL